MDVRNRLRSGTVVNSGLRRRLPLSPEKIRENHSCLDHVRSRRDGHQYPAPNHQRRRRLLQQRDEQPRSYCPPLARPVGCLAVASPQKTHRSIPWLGATQLSAEAHLVASLHLAGKLPTQPRPLQLLPTLPKKTHLPKQPANPNLHRPRPKI